MVVLPVSCAAVQDGRLTHGYTRAQGDTLDVDQPRVHALIARRRQAKKNHDFKKADALREELRRECNVEVFDKTMIWKVIGSTGHVPLPKGQASGRAPESSAAPLTAAAAEAKRLKKKQRKAAKKAAAKVALAPITTGFGHAMLLKMGWEGEGSGLREGALVRPLKALPPAERRLRQGTTSTDMDATVDGGSAATATTAAPKKRGSSSREVMDGANAEELDAARAPPTKKRRLNGRSKAKLKRRAELEASVQHAVQSQQESQPAGTTARGAPGPERPPCSEATEDSK